MLEIARLMSWMSAGLLCAALAIWLQQRRGPLPQRVDGRRSMKPAQSQVAGWLLLLSVGICSVAAVLAVASLMTG